MPFNPEEVKDDPDFQKFISDTVSNATAGLSSKNEELLSDLGKLKNKLKDVPDSDKLKELQDAANKLTQIEKETLEKSGEYQKLLENATKQHDEELKKAREKEDKLTSNLRKTLVNGSLTTALASAKVSPTLLPAAVKLLESEVSFVEIDGEYQAKVGDKTVEQFVEDWSKTDVGKNFIVAGRNSGGGPGGNGDGGSDDGTFDKYFDKKNPEYSMTEQAKLYKKDKAEYDRLKKKHG